MKGETFDSVSRLRRPCGVIYAAAVFQTVLRLTDASELSGLNSSEARRRGGAGQSRPDLSSGQFSGGKKAPEGRVLFAFGRSRTERTRAALPGELGPKAFSKDQRMLENHKVTSKT